MGEPRWLTYFGHIACAFDLIAENPRTGVDRSIFVPGMRSISCQKHVIFFKCLDTADGTPVVLRIVHERRHMPALVYFDDLSAVRCS